MTRQQKFQKKKERERRVHKKTLRRREQLRAEARVEATKVREERSHQKDLNKFRGATMILNKEGQPLSDEEIKARLAHNLEILKALEEEREATLKAEPVRNWGGEAEVTFKPN